MKTVIKLVLLLVFFSTSVLAQTVPSGVAKGVVMDQDGYPVVGAAIFVKESPKSITVSGGDGRFELKLPAKAKTLVVSCLGMKEANYVLTDKLTSIKIVMTYENNSLDQVVITGYAQTTTKKMTGSVGVLTQDAIKNKPATSIDAMMQGEIAGVAVQSVSGQPGTQSKIRIRGTNNLSGNSDPLWVVDGVPLQGTSPDLTSDQIKTGGFDDIFVSGIGGINPHDIENVTILKDAAAAAIYGSRAANGVIVVTTKRGQQGKMRVNYSNNFSVSLSPQKSNNLMNSSEKLNWEQTLWDEFSATKYKASLTDNTVFYPVIGVVGQIRAGLGKYSGMKNDVAAQDAAIRDLSKVNTNWYNLLFRNAFSQNHHLSLSGGSDKYTYYVSLGYTKDKGMLIHNDYDRYNFTANITLNPVDYIKLDFGVDFAHQLSVTPQSYVDAFQYAYFANPYEKAYNSDGSYSPDETYFSLGYNNGDNTIVMPDNGFNILRELNENKTKTKNWSTTLRSNIDVRLIKQLHFVGLASYSYSNNSTNEIVGEDTYSAFRDRLGKDKYSTTNTYGSIAQNSANMESYVVRGHFVYNEKFGENHSVNIIAGSELRSSSSNAIFTKRYNYDPSTGTTSLPPISGEQDAWLRAVEALNGEYFSKNRYASFYASADYFYSSKYVLNFSFRTDGSSHFGSDKQFNPTWSAGGAWHVSEEKFLKGNRVISHLILRAATGFTGDVNTSTTPQLVMSYYRQQYRYVNGKGYLMGYIPTAPNPNLRWEKTHDVKASVDIGLFNDRINFIGEGYYRKSSDVVTTSQVLSTTGFYSQSFNSANIENKGLEGTLSGTIYKSKDWRVNASVNIAFNHNKVTKYIPAYATKITVKDRYVQGYPVGSIFAGKVTGIDPDNGLYTFQLRPDAVITTSTDLNKPDNYRYYLGTTIAPITGGFNFSADYKNFRLSISGVYSLGAKKYDKISSPASYYSPKHDGVPTETIQSQYSDLYANYLNVKKDMIKRWTESNKNGAKYPRIYDYFGQKYNFDYTNVMDSDIVDAIYLKNISYLRIKTIILTYTLPSEIAKKAKLGDVSVNLSLNNFITITKYDGMDPEVPGATYPTTRSISLGFNIGF